MKTSKNFLSDIDLSVILPICHITNNLSRCIHSLLIWNSAHVEFLFVLDRSLISHKIQIEKQLKEYQAQDKRIRILYSEGGCACAKNKGLCEASGTYIGFVNSDDFVDPSMFEKLLTQALCDKYDYAYTGYQTILGDATHKKPVQSDLLDTPYSLGTRDLDYICHYIANAQPAIWQGIYKKSLLYKNNISFQEYLAPYADLPFHLEALFAVRSMICVSEHLYFHQIHSTCESQKSKKGIGKQYPTTSDDRLFTYFCVFDYLDRKLFMMNSQRKTDCLQLVKVATHRSICRQIAPIWRHEYKKRAKNDLYNNISYIQTICLLLKDCLLRVQ